MTDSPAEGLPLRDEIFQRMDELTPAERKVARTLLARYPAAGLESTAALAAAAGTSKPTVLRLLDRLGFGSYPEFQQRLRDEVTRSMSARKVSLGLTNLSRKITSVITHFTFFQNEPVDEKHLPLRMTAYFADEKENRISNENIIIAESASNKPEERTYKEKFTLKDMEYDKDATYYLILKDEDELVNTELDKIPFVIDLVFGGSIRF